MQQPQSQYIVETFNSPKQNVDSEAESCPVSRILLLNPDFNYMSEQTGQNTRRVARSITPFQQALAPLGLATISALTPESFDVEIWDETINGRVEEYPSLLENRTIIGVSGYINHAERILQLGELVRNSGAVTVLGGPGVSSDPDLFRSQFDVLFIGEAEYTWPEFLRERPTGGHRPEYRQVEKVDMTHSPMPDWKSINVRSYLMGAVQTTRGCPFDCEFCDVVTIFGRTARSKPIAQVLQEVEVLVRRGVRRILFSDDNFIGNRGYARELLRGLIVLNRKLRNPISYFTNVTLNVARHEELLELLVEANFPGVFIGIESPNRDSLIEANKPQNYRTDMLEDLKKIQSYGIVVQTGMIVGFDHDDTSIFDAHFDFLQAAGIATPLINVLKAPTSTKLWKRLQQEDRLLQLDPLAGNNVESITNIIPRRMSIRRLLEGYEQLMQRLCDWNHFERRIEVLLDTVEHSRPARQTSYWREMFAFPLLLLSMPRQARKATFRLLVRTMMRHRDMVQTVAGLICYQYMETLKLPAIHQSIQQQLERLSADDVSTAPIPECEPVSLRDVNR